MTKYKNQPPVSFLMIFSFAPFLQLFFTSSSIMLQLLVIRFVIIQWQLFFGSSLGNIAIDLSADQPREVLAMAEDNTASTDWKNIHLIAFAFNAKSFPITTLAFLFFVFFFLATFFRQTVKSFLVNVLS